MGTRVDRSRPLTAALLAAACLANLGLVFILMREHPNPPVIPLLGPGLLCMLQAFAGAQALEGRRLVLSWLALAGTVLQTVLVPLMLDARSLIPWALGLCLVLAAAACVPLLPVKARSTTH